MPPDAAPIQFTEAQWAAIRAELGNGPKTEAARFPLEVEATTLRDLRLIGLERPAPTRTKARAMQKHGRALLDAIRSDRRSASALTLHGFDVPEADRRLQEFDTLLAGLVREAERYASPRRRFSTNHDALRAVIWNHAGQIYEEVSGRFVGVSSGAADGTAISGPFVRFIQAFTSAVPGEPVPTGDIVRAFVRRHWRGRTVASVA